MDAPPLPTRFFFDGEGLADGREPQQHPLRTLDDCLAAAEHTYRTFHERHGWDWTARQQDLHRNMESYRGQIALVYQLQPDLWAAFLNTGNPALSLSHQHYYGHRENCIGFPVLEITSSKQAVDGYRQVELIHELGHFLDTWSPFHDMTTTTNISALRHQHSDNGLFSNAMHLDTILYPDGIARFIECIHRASYPDGCEWRPQELFAVATGYYFGPRQFTQRRSPVLEAYMEEVVGLDIAVLRSDLPDMDKHRLREILHKHTAPQREETPAERPRLPSFRPREYGRAAATAPADAPAPDDPAPLGPRAFSAARSMGRMPYAPPRRQLSADEQRYHDALDRYETLSAAAEPAPHQLAMARKELESLMTGRIRSAVEAARQEMAATGLDLPAGILAHGRGRKI